MHYLFAPGALPEKDHYGFTIINQWNLDQRGRMVCAMAGHTFAGTPGRRFPWVEGMTA